jgi:glycerophosphoryl diester phosphodiesterase
LLAFAQALALGATHLETDVHASRDGIAVLSHDPNLARLARREAQVNSLTLAELKQIDLGDGQTFVSLEEVLAAFPDARFNIDVKSADAIGPTIDAVRAAGAIRRVLVTSFSEARRRRTVAGLAGVASSASSTMFAIALLASKLGLSPVVRAILRSVHAVQVPEIAFGMRIVTPRLVRMVHSARCEIHVWTINDAASMTRLFALGIDGVVTDRADLALELLRNRA